MVAGAISTIAGLAICLFVMLKKYKENAKENSYWVNILGEYFWEGTDMNTGYTNTVNSITAKDLQEFTKALLEQNNRVEVSMTSEETK